MAKLFESLSLNNLKNKVVKRAYTELAAEVIEQYQSLPLKVTSWEGRGKKESDALQAASKGPIPVGFNHDPYNNAKKKLD